jgi:hypothetical protein
MRAFAAIASWSGLIIATLELNFFRDGTERLVLAISPMSSPAASFRGVAAHIPSSERCGYSAGSQDRVYAYED